MEGLPYERAGDAHQTSRFNPLRNWLFITYNINFALVGGFILINFMEAVQSSTKREVKLNVTAIDEDIYYNFNCR